MDLQRRAGDGGTLVGRQRGVTHQQMHFVYQHVQLFGHQLGQGCAQTSSQIHMAVQSSHAAIVPNSQQALIAFTGVACDKRGLAHHRRGLWQRRTQHQQHTTGIENIAALLDPKCAHQADLFAAFGDIKAAAR